MQLEAEHAAKIEAEQERRAAARGRGNTVLDDDVHGLDGSAEYQWADEPAFVEA